MEDGAGWREGVNRKHGVCKIRATITQPGSVNERGNTYSEREKKWSNYAWTSARKAKNAKGRKSPPMANAMVSGKKGSRTTEYFKKKLGLQA